MSVVVDALGKQCPIPVVMAKKALAELQTTPPSGRRVFLLKDVRLFLNSLDRGLRLVREAGIGAESRREDTEDAILLTIRIPKSRQVG